MKARLTPIESAAELEAFFRTTGGPFTAVDGILGTGLKGNIEGIFYDVVRLINQHIDEVVSLDIPTGVSGDSGAIQGAAIQATLTVSFGFPKIGHFLPPGAGKRGRLVNVDISLPPKFRREGDKFLLMPGRMSELIQQRDRYGHKNAFGHTLLIGGSRGRLGAISMAARACHRMGTGLVTVATWEDCLDLLMARLPDETMAFALPDDAQNVEEVQRLLSNYSCVVIGPGMGTRPSGKLVVQEVLGSFQGPVVLDADALNLVADHKLHDYLVARKHPTVLTPHPGEMARLLEADKERVVEDPVGALQEAVARTHSIVLLKGAATLISSPDEVLYLNHYPNDGMATAGSGDVLAGMIGGLLSQRMDSFEATQLAVYLHSLAGDHAARTQGHRSMTATDIIESIAHGFRELRQQQTPTMPVEGRAELR